MFHIIGSTGRTGTNFIAGTLNQLTDVLALHEGYELVNGNPKLVLPSINLENFAVFKSPEKASEIIATKRGLSILDGARQSTGASTMIDIAYYNAVMAPAILAAHPKARFIGIIRNCYDFVRSAAFLTGEDFLAVGWPDPKKTLSSRESFIAMGRIRPLRGTEDHKLWKDWGTIERNIWLWRETNLRLLDTRQIFPDRVELLAFEKMKKEPESFWSTLLGCFNLPSDDKTIAMLINSKASQNRKATGYQIGERSDWTSYQTELLEDAQLQVNVKWNQ